MSEHDQREFDPEPRADALADAAFTVDEGWRFTSVNARAARLFGRSRERLRGSVIWDEFPETTETRLPDEFHRAVEAGESRSFEVYHQPRDSRLEVHVTPTGDELSVVLRDVTDRADRRRQLRRRAELVDIATEPMFAIDAGGQVVDLNDALAELTGSDHETLLGMPVSELVTPTDDDDALATALAGDEPATAMVVVERAGGDRRHCEATLAPVTGDAGGDELVCVLRDLTDQRQREQRVAVFDRVLRHNIRNDLNVVLARAEMIQSRTDDPDVAGDAEAIVEEVMDLLTISDHVRQFADAMDPSVGRSRVHHAGGRVREVVETVRSQFPGADVRLVLHDDPCVRAHESVFTAIQELVENGVVHAEESLVRVSVAATGTPEDGRVRIEVADRGDGIPNPEREVLTAGGETSLAHASGLGLWLVNWAVSKSGGDLSFSSGDTWGSRVSVELARAPPLE